MKKLFTMLILAIFAVSALAGCQNLSGNKGDTSSDSSVDVSSDFSNSDDCLLDGYTEIDDDKITVTDKEKTYTDTGISMRLPADWNGQQSEGEDGTSYIFNYPELKEKCWFSFYITGAAYKLERTETEYLEYFSEIGLENVKIISCAKEKLCGFEGTKVVISYTEDGEDLIRIDFDNVITGVRMYAFTFTYPTSDKECEAVVESILDSIVITAI